MNEPDDALSIIVPTVGRPSLKDTLESILTQIKPCDQILVIADGVYPESRQFVETKGTQFTYIELADGPHHDWGARARNLAIPLATKAYIAFMDDDDQYLSGAFKSMKNAIRAFPGRPFLFRMKHGKRIIWTRRELFMGNVSSQMVLFPNKQDKLARFTDRYEGDYDFIQRTADRWSPGYDPFVWREEVTSILLKANGLAT